jgi:excisionase family DNA binding protein
MASRRKIPDPAPPRPRPSKQKTAEHLGVSERTVGYMVADGRLTGYRLGRTIRFDLNEIDDGMVAFGGSVS